jgi:hypothetical protein
MGFARKISAYYLTALMFVATTNIVLSAHICPNGFYTLFLNESPISCCSNHSPGNETGHSHDHSQSGSLAVSDGNFCCFTKTIETTGVDVVYPSIGIRKIDYKVAVFQLELFDISLPSEAIQKTAFKPYLPQLPDRDIPVLVQSFLL